MINEFQKIIFENIIIFYFLIIEMNTIRRKFDIG